MKYTIRVGHTIYGVGQDYCHIVLFSKGPMFELQPCYYYEIFSQLFLHVMVGQNLEKSNAKETTFFYFI